MESSQYGSSDIIWKRTDPKTVELSNISPPMAPPGLPETPALTAEAQPLSPAGMTSQEMEHFARAMGMRMREREQVPQTAGEVATQQRAQKQQWRKQLRMFDQYMRKGGTDRVSGIQELIENGAMRIDENGDVFTSVAMGSKRRQDALLDAAREWNDWRRDQLAYGEDINMMGQSIGQEMEKRFVEVK